MPTNVMRLGYWAILLGAMVGVVALFWRSEFERGHPRAEILDPVKAFPLTRPIPDFHLTNQFNMPVNLESLAGFVWVADVIFSTCPGQCHQLSQQMRAVQKRLPPGGSVRLVSLTADPEYDTPPVLDKYGQRYGYQPSNWLFLTGPKSPVYDLAIKGLLFSVVEQPENLRANVDDRFIHSTAFALVDRDGLLRGVVQGEETNAVEQILARVNWLLLERRKP